jgi:hypothetical protein
LPPCPPKGGLIHDFLDYSLNVKELVPLFGIGGQLHLIIFPLRITVSMRLLPNAYGINSYDGISFVINTLATLPTAIDPCVSEIPIA